MKKLLFLTLLGLLPFMMTGCHEQIPAGTKGKIMGASGFQPEVYPPSKVWLDTTFTMTPEKLYLVQTTTQKYTQPITVKLAEEKLDVTVEVVFKGRIRNDDNTINAIFNDIPMNDNIVTVNEVYNVYGKPIVNSAARDIISKYNVDELPKNYGRIIAELHASLTAKLKGTPIEINDVTIGKVSYPEVVEASIKTATERRMAIEKEEAEVQIRLTEARGKEQVAAAMYNVKMMEAKRIRDYNAMTAKGVTPELLKLRELELREKELNKWSGVYPLSATTIMGGASSVIVDTK